MIPTSRKEFKEFCLRRLGAGANKVNLTEAQVDDAVDRAMYLFTQYHMDATEKTYFRYQITQQDITNGYITLPENIIGAIRIFPVGSAMGANSLFSMQYQFIVNDLYNFSNVSLLPYYLTMQHIQFMEEMLVGQKSFRFNRFNNILYLDMDMSVLAEGQWLVVEAYNIIDANQYVKVWSDRWLQDYTSALMRKEYGQNLIKFETMMPSSTKMNGRMIYEDGVREITELEDQLMTRFNVPSMMLIQ